MVLCPACQQPKPFIGMAKPRMASSQHYRCTACRRTFHLQYQQNIHVPGVRANITDLALIRPRHPRYNAGAGHQPAAGEEGGKKMEAVNQLPPLHPHFVADPPSSYGWAPTRGGRSCAAKGPALALAGRGRSHGAGAGGCIRAAHPRHALPAAGGVAHRRLASV